MILYVISDLHLHSNEPMLLKAFSSFVESLEDHSQLFIIGDLFNFFIGIDHNDKAQQVVKDTLAKAKHRGVVAYFIHGNRDFLLKQQEANWLNLILLKDHEVLLLPQLEIFLSHGDLFCSNDLAYLSYHKKVNNPLLQFLFRLLPLFFRRVIAEKIRKQSQHANKDKRVQNTLFEVVPHTIAEIYQNCIKDSSVLDLKDDSQALNIKKQTIVVHGHLHSFTQYDKEHKAYQFRYVLGAWGEKFSYFKYNTDSQKVEFSELTLASLLKAQHSQ